MLQLRVPTLPTMRSARFIVLLAIIIAFFGAVSTSASSATRPMQVKLSQPNYADGSTTVRVTVQAEGSPVIALLPNSVSVAELTVNGNIAQRAGRDVSIGQWPFGHGAAAFRLGGIHIHDRVEIRMSGRAGPPRILADVDALGTAFGSGLGSGLFLGLLITIAIFQIIAIFALRDATMVWYVAFVTAVVGIDALRSDFFSIDQSVALTMFVVLNVVTAVCSFGFVTSYLRLYSDARHLYWILLAATAITSLAPGLTAAIRHVPVSIPLLFGWSLLTISVSIIVALMRRRAGYMPASYIAFGLLGIAFAFGSKVYRDIAGAPSPFLDAWGINFGSAFDFLVFALGIAYRTRFALRHHHLMENALREANHAATHDPLTTLLNRRGLDEWVESAGPGMRTVLFIDIDGFKAVNDLGGHTAGDDTLSIVARIIRHAVRDEDTVARVGGDEFVAILDVEPDAPIVADIMTRISSAVTFLRPLGADKDLHIGVSIGVGRLIGDRSFADALREADTDAYRVKAEHHATTRRARAARKGQRLGTNPR